MAKKAKAKTSKTKPRPKSIGPLRKKLDTLSGDLKAIIAAGKDKKGTLTSGQLKKAKKAKKALDKTLTYMKNVCVQGHAPV